MTVLESLKAARAKIAHPQNWTQGQHARTKYGNPVSENSSLATCWCIIGALWAVNPEPYEARILLGKVIGQSVIAFNDAKDRTHAEVLNAFDRAIASLEGK